MEKEKHNRFTTLTCKEKIIILKVNHTYLYEYIYMHIIWNRKTYRCIKILKKEKR